MTLDRRGDCDVQVHEKDRELAILIMVFVRGILASRKINVTDAIVNEASTSGTHDMIGTFSSSQSALDLGRLSVELKCRRLGSENGWISTRKDLRKEAVENCDWWQVATQKNNHPWCGRSILLVGCKQSPGTWLFECRCEWKPLEGPLQVFWEWKHAHVKNVQLVAKAAPKSVPKAAAAPPRVRLPTPLVAQPSFPALSYRIEVNHWGERKRVARVMQLMEKIGKRDLLHPGRDISAIKKRRSDLGHDTPAGQHTDEMFQVGRAFEKKGGKKEWMSSERVMKLLYHEWVAKAAAEARRRV